MATNESDKLKARGVAKESELAGVGQRKPYRPPVLTTYGHISKLTMALAGSGADGSNKATMRRTCL